MNPIEWIADAIGTAATRVKGGLDIRIICYKSCPQPISWLVDEF